MVFVRFFGQRARCSTSKTLSTLASKSTATQFRRRLFVASTTINVSVDEQRHCRGQGACLPSLASSYFVTVKQGKLPMTKATHRPPQLKTTDAVTDGMTIS